MPSTEDRYIREPGFGARREEVLLNERSLPEEEGGPMTDITATHIKIIRTKRFLGRTMGTTKRNKGRIFRDRCASASKRVRPLCGDFSEMKRVDGRFNELCVAQTRWIGRREQEPANIMALGR